VQILHIHVMSSIYQLIGHICSSCLSDLFSMVYHMNLQADIFDSSLTQSYYMLFALTINLEYCLKKEHLNLKGTDRCEHPFFNIIA